MSGVGRDISHNFESIVFVSDQTLYITQVHHAPLLACPKKFWGHQAVPVSITTEGLEAYDHGDKHK